MTITTDRTDLHGISPVLFERLVTRIVRDEQTEPVLARRIAGQTLAFLEACALNPGAGLVPSALVDIGWHAFIIHTYEYTEFCERVAGRFIHHSPVDVRADESVHTAAIGDTVAAMRAAGLPVDIELWVADGRCSQCYSGCADDPRNA